MLKSCWLVCIILILTIICSCSKAPEVDVSKVRKDNIEATVSSVNSGIVRAEQIAELAFGAVGRVKNLNVKLGDTVEKDFIIAELENQDVLIAYEAARREMDRQLTLSKSGASSPSLLDQTNSQFRAAEEAYNRSIIKAPFKGVVAELNMEVGQLSQITAEFKKALIRLVDLAPRYVRAEIDEVDLPKIKVGQNAKVKILAIRPEPFNARLRKIVPFINSVREQDRTCEIELDLENAASLVAGASADVEIVTDSRKDVLMVPIKSVFNSKGKKYVYKLEDSIIKKTAVEIGLTNYQFAQIVSGLSENNQVAILSEKYELADGIKIVAKPT